MAYVRWSELEIDPARLVGFMMLTDENVREVRKEPGVIAFYTAAEKGHPNHIRVLEIYIDESAYQAHLQIANFRKIRASTSQMVLNRRLFEAAPVELGAKPGLPPTDTVVRIAELEIDPTQLDAYKATVIMEIDTAVRVEPGVFAIYAVALKDQPNQLRFFEIYADERAYLLHRESLHFRKYLDTTQSMITARILIDATPGFPSSQSR